MALENVNDRSAQPNPIMGREVASGVEDNVEKDVRVTFESARSNMQEMLQMNFGIIHELLGQIGAINPFRPDAALGKQPDIAVSDASSESQAAPVAPVGKSSASAYIAGLQHVNDALGNHDMKLQQVFDQMELSRSGRKPDLYNHGVEYNQLMSIVNQAKTRLYQLEKMLPESLPENSDLPLRELMPEFSEALKQYDAGFQHLLGLLQEEIRQSKQAARSQ